MGDFWHVWPQGDLKTHVTRGLWCHCQPCHVLGDGGLVVVHNAYDAREFYEEDESECLKELGGPSAAGKSRGH